MDHPEIPNLRVGTSSWSAGSWVGPFYPPGTRPADFLPVYSQHFDTVEVDSTFYRAPSKEMVKNWYARTPAGFIFAAKFPQTITHEKVLLDCDAETTEFVGTMELLGEKLGPLLLQFPYFSHETFATSAEFTARLIRFLDSLPSGHSYAVEIRNKNWLTAPFVDLLRQKNVALALVDQGWMPAIDQLSARLDVLTAGFTYVRLLGDRHAIEKQTKTWDRIIVNRERETQTWVRYVRQFL